MTDSIQVLKPGWRALDANADVYPGAVLYFYDGGTATPRTVYSDRSLSGALGTSVTCDSGGFPTSDGSTKVEIYTGTSAYKVTLKDADGNTIWTIDDIKGALDTSVFLTSAPTASVPITNTSSNQTPAVGDKGKFYNVDCSGGDVSFTLGLASDLGNGWSIKVRDDGTANQVKIIGTSGELFKVGGRAGVAAFALVSRGQTVTITCDGTGFKVEQTSPNLFATTGVILIADRLSTPPGSPADGARYLVTTSPTGAWSAFSVGDIAEASGQGTWFAITPPTDCGWLAYVQDENAYYSFQDSAWVAVAASLQGVAARADVEAASSAVLAVTPSVMRYSPYAIKVWLKANVSGGVPTLAVSQGVTGIADTATGQLGVTYSQNFSTANYCAIPGVERHTTSMSGAGGGETCTIRNGTMAVDGLTIDNFTYDGGTNNSLSYSDPASWSLMCAGTLA